MKLLFAYEFCTMGGVETALKNRVSCIDVTACEIEFLFRFDFGGMPLFSDMGYKVHIEENVQNIQNIIRAGQFDKVLVIDTPVVQQALNQMDYAGKVILEVHTTYTSGLEYLKKLKSDLLTCVIVPSEYQKRLVTECCQINAPIYVLPNALNTSVFYERDIALQSEQRILLWVGRLDAHKNWRLFLSIASEIHKRDSNIVFWIVGGLKGERVELEAFQQMVYSLQLQTCLRWIPFVDYEKVPGFYSIAGQSKGAYIVTSKNESFGMTILEAMSCNCPVIVNDVGALGELVRHDTGLAFKMDDTSIDKAADRIMGFINDVELIEKCKSTAQQMIEERYTSEVVGARFLEIMNSL